MSFVVEDAREEFLPQIAEIERECFSLPWTEKMLRGQLDGERCVFLAAREGETVLGYVGLTYVLDEGYISNVAVSPAYRRRGVAGALVAELIRRGRALRLAFLTLEVREGNAPAVALYAKHGFRVVGRRKGYYEKPREDALLMTLELETEAEE